MPSPIVRHHATWLSLIEVSGPFLTLPVLGRALPQGLEPVDPELSSRLRLAHEEWQGDPSLHGEWVRWVLASVLGFDPSSLLEGPAVPATLAYPVPEHGETLRPHLVVCDPPRAGEAVRPRIVVNLWPAGQRLDGRIPDSRRAAIPLDRMVELCRASDVRLGLVTNGRHWTLVDAPRLATSGFATWDAELWREEPLTLAAFRTLLGAHRLFAVAEADTLEALLAESADAQEEVTNTLGAQVRAAVELLVDAFSRADRDSGGKLLQGIEPPDLYSAALMVMMRLVFLLSAEERGLFLLGDPVYDASYAVSTLRGQLQEEAARFGEEPLENRSTAWHRLLATFRMVHGGVQHEQLRLPAYGGALFDPHRFPFLEGRRGEEPLGLVDARPLPIDDRTVLHILDALQVLRRRGSDEAQRLSYRALDVEQIGHVYEGLLDHTAVRPNEPAIGLRGKLEPEVALAAIEEQAERGANVLVSWLSEQTGLTPRAVARDLATPLDLPARGRLLAACDNSEELLERLEPYHALLRSDLRGLPTVYPTGSTYVTKTTERRSSGTYYTPRSLAEEVVTHTLDPLVYQPGPAEGAQATDWRLRPAGELLRLRVCDMAMGSGAFLVAACRYLAARLLEAWEAASEEAPAGITIDGAPATGGAGEILVPVDPEERLVLARRLVADRCLYGVDRNPMAVEMAKLSMWLVTLAKGRPFSFLDHALRCGDSLVGVAHAPQLAFFHPDPDRGNDLHGARLFDDVVAALTAGLERAGNLRRRLASFPVMDPRDAEEKARLFTEALKATEALRVVGDVLAGAMLSTAGQGPDALDRRLLGAARDVAAALESSAEASERVRRLSRLAAKARGWLAEDKPPIAPERSTFHWPLEFPEVLEDPDRLGFDAVVGNPPFLGGQKITGALGTGYRENLVRHLANGVRGTADLVAYFFLRGSQICRAGGRIGLLSTNTIAQGDTREAGLEQLRERGWSISRAVKSRPWPGDATLEVAQVWLHHGTWAGTAILDGVQVGSITPALEPASRVSGQPYRLAANAGKSFIGSYVLGMGFILTPQQAQDLIDRDPRNADVLFPYLNGEDLNSRPDQSPRRWVINFFDWPEEKARQYTDCWRIIEENVKPDRQRLKDDGRYALRKPLPQRYWIYAEKRPGLYSAIEGLDRVLVIARISKTVQAVFVPTGTVFNEKTVVFTYDDDGHFGLLASTFHWWWAVTHSSTLRTDTQYTPTDCFETFPQPELTAPVEKSGGALDGYRRALMLDRSEGLTATYNRVHNPSESGQDIAELRRLHVELDHAVAAAYGWEDLELDHSFHETRQGIRYTLGPVARNEVLDRLLELNHQRYAEEGRLGSGAKRAGRVRKPPTNQFRLGEV